MCKVKSRCKEAFDLLGKQVRFEHMSSHYLENVVLRTSPVIDSAEIRPRAERSLALARVREKKQREDAEEKVRKANRVTYHPSWLSGYRREQEELEQKEEEPEVVALDPEAEPVKVDRGLDCPDKTFTGTCTVTFDHLMCLTEKGKYIMKWIGQADGYPMAVHLFRTGELDLLGARVVLMTVRPKEGEGEAAKKQEEEERQGFLSYIIGVGERKLCGGPVPLPFGAGRSNRWVKVFRNTPWKELEKMNRYPHFVNGKLQLTISVMTHAGMKLPKE